MIQEEGLKTTKNDKIYVAQSVFTDLAFLRREIECLKEIISTNADGIMDYVRNIVPTYKKAE